MEKEFRCWDPYILFAQTLKVHLNSRVSPVPSNAMPEPGGIEIGAKLSIQPAEDIQVEIGCDTLLVVVSC
jgi:hypothetical protein